MSTHVVLAALLVAVSWTFPNVLVTSIKLAPESILSLAPWSASSSSNRTLLTDTIGSVGAEQFYAFHFISPGLSMIYLVVYIWISFANKLGSTGDFSRAAGLVAFGLLVACWTSFSGDAFGAADGEFSRSLRPGAGNLLVGAAMWMWSAALAAGIASIGSKLIGRASEKR